MTAPVAMVQVCTAFDESGTCTELVWMPYSPGPLPALSLADAGIIAAKIALLWGIAFGLRCVRRALNT